MLQLLPACKLHPVLQPIEFPVLVLLHLLLPVTHVHVWAYLLLREDTLSVVKSPPNNRRLLGKTCILKKASRWIPWQELNPLDWVALNWAKQKTQQNKRARTKLKWHSMHVSRSICSLPTRLTTKLVCRDEYLQKRNWKGLGGQSSHKCSYGPHRLSLHLCICSIPLLPSIFPPAISSFPLHNIQITPSHRG